jgi:hypothetical protein
MKDYGRFFKGNLKIPFKSTLPTHMGSVDERKLIFVEDEEKLYLGKSDQWVYFSGKDNPKNINYDITVTVGSGGDFSTINQALEYLSHYYPLYVKSGFTAEVKLLTGFVMAEQVLIYGVDLGWIDIISEDSSVTINRSALTITDAAYYPAFSAFKYGKLPNIRTLFNMDSSGDSSGRVGIYLHEGGQCNITNGGVKNTPTAGCLIYRGGFAIMYEADFSYSYYGVKLLRGGYLESQHLNVSHCTDYGLLAQFGCNVDAQETNAQHCNFGVSSQSGSVMNVGSSDARECTTYGFHVGGASILMTSGVKGTLSQTIRTITVAGIII